MRYFNESLQEYKVRSNRPPIKKAKISRSADTNEFIRPLWEGISDYESFCVLYLNAANNTIAYQQVSKGGITGTIADMRLILKGALDTLCCSMIICHNHPSGSLNPSHADVKCTEKIKAACDLFDIKLLDHVILSGDDNHYYSFADEGIL